MMAVWEIALVGYRDDDAKFKWVIAPDRATVRRACIERDWDYEYITLTNLDVGIAGINLDLSGAEKWTS